MNLDLASTFRFGDAQALAFFFLDHRVVHEQVAAALAAQLGQSITTFDVSSAAAEAEWAEAMSTQTPGGQALDDWLHFHADIHNTTYQLIFGTGTYPPDLSQVDFSKPTGFYDWMYVHQIVHDYEQQALGLT